MYLKCLVGWLTMLSCALPSIVAAQGVTVVDGIAEAAVNTKPVLVLQVMDGNNTELQQDGLRVFFRLAPAPPASTRVCHEPASAEDTSCLPYATTDENGQVRVLLQIGHNEGNLEVIAQTSGGQPVSHAVTVLDASLEVGGNTDTGPAVQDSALPLSLKAELKDKEGADIAGRCVTAEVTQGGGTLLGSDDAACPMTSPEKRTALTDDEGKVEFTVQRAGSGDEDIVVQVSALGLTVPFLDIVGSLDTPDVPQDIDVFGDVIYIADRTGLQVIDIKKPTSPKPIQSIDLEGTVSRLALDGDRLYVPTSNLMRLYVLDITEPSSPNRRGVVDLVGDVESHGIKGVVAENGHAFIVTDARTNASGTLQVVDVQDGDNPKVVGTALLRFRPRGIAVLGNRVYVTSGDGLFIFNISDPTQPIEERGPMGNFSDITLNGNVAYVVEVRANQYYFTVLDLSVPSTPQLRGALQVQRVRAIDTNFPIAVRGRFACLVEFAFGLLAIDVNDPKTPRWMARIDTPSEVLSVAIAGAGGFIYATDLIFGLQVIRGPLFDRDRNMDGIPDDFLDLDEDGIIDFFDVFPDDPTENRDTNRDGIGDEADEDDDSDGFTDTDEEEASPPTDPKDPRIFPLTLPPSGTTTIVVDADVGAATHPAERNGTPATPYLSITEGLRVIKAWRRQGIDSPLTLEVRAGTYSPTRTQEIFPLEFAGTGPLTLRGAGQEATVIDAAFTAPVLRVSDATGVVIENVTCLHGEYGIFGNRAKSITLCWNRIAENVFDGISLGINSPEGILITENLIEGNAVDGIFLFENAEAEISLNMIEGNMDNGVQVHNNSTATITGNEIRSKAGSGIFVSTNACAVINGGRIADSQRSGVHLQRDSFAAIGFGAEAAGNLTLTQNVVDGITIVDDGSFALINPDRVIFDANGGGEIVGPFTDNPADPGVARIRCFMP